jgi:SSS family solute:Na+ symporter
MTQLVIIAAYLVLLLFLGLFSSRLFRGTSQDYMLASHSIGPFLLVMSIFGTTMTAFALVGSTGESFKEGVGVYGQLASSSGIIHSLCFFLIGVKLWSFGRKYGYTTQIQFFRDRLESNRIGYLLFPILVGLVIPYLLIGVISSGAVINGVTEGAFSHWFAAADYGVPNWLGSLVISLVVLVYVFYGGMRGTAWANTFQTLLFMVLGVVTFFVISNRLGGLQSATQAVLAKHPGRLSRALTQKEVADYETQRDAWESLAHYNWAVEHKGFKLSPEQLAEAHAALHKPEAPAKEDHEPVASARENPQAAPLRLRVGLVKAEARYAAEHELLDLTMREKAMALLDQDDRVYGPNDELLTAEGERLALHHFPRSDTWPKKALAMFEDKVGNPNEPLDPDNPEAGNKWTRRRALGVYRAAMWAPEEPHPMGKLVFLTYMLVPLSVGMFPHLFQHWLTARKASNFKVVVVAHPIFIMIVWVPCVLVGVWATSAVLDGRPLIPPHFPPNAVLAKMVKDLSGDFLGGLLTAGVLAAIMSSLDSQFLCLGTMFTTDIVLHRAAPDRYSERSKILMARSFIVAIVAVTYGLSLLEPRRVFTLGVWCFSGFSALFPLVFAAVYWRRLTKAGAYAAVAAAFASWLYFFVDSNFGGQPGYTFDITLGGATYSMMAVAPMLLCSLAAMLVVSLVTRPPSQETLDQFFGDQPTAAEQVPESKPAPAP